MVLLCLVSWTSQAIIQLEEWGNPPRFRANHFHNKPIFHHLVCIGTPALHSHASRSCMYSTLNRIFLLDRSMRIRTLHESPFYCVIHATRLGDRFQSYYSENRGLCACAIERTTAHARSCSTVPEKISATPGFEPSTFECDRALMKKAL